MPAPENVDAYLAALPDDQRSVMQELRQTINAAAPEAVETIAYGMPALRSHRGQFLVSYAAFKQHYSLFPSNDAIIEALGDEIRPYLAGKGTIQFPASQPIPLATVAKVVRIRFEENAARDRR
jgi:uncharacterized protein YdhG (YjbR/CyaY superfamily)